MIRKIIKIEENLCNGCGACAEACHESAIQMVNGKAKLIRDDYCDGLGDCLPVCPTNAIRFEEREAAAYDEAAVKANQQAKKTLQGCQGHRAKTIQRQPNNTVQEQSMESQLSQWPVQIKLVSVEAPYFENADLLIAADCTAYAYGDFHRHFIRNRVTIIGCPKLDDIDYTGKLTEIIKHHTIQSITVVRMEVPCCGGIEMAVKQAIQASGKQVPCQIIAISINGEILD